MAGSWIQRQRLKVVAGLLRRMYRSGKLPSPPTAENIDARLDSVRPEPFDEGRMQRIIGNLNLPNEEQPQ